MRLTRQAALAIALVAGLLAALVPEAYGGSEVGPVAYALSVMELAAADCSLAVTMAVTNMVAETIHRFGTEEQRRRCLPPLASGEWLAGSFGLYLANGSFNIGTPSIVRKFPRLIDSDQRYSGSALASAMCTGRPSKAVRPTSVCRPGGIG